VALGGGGLTFDGGGLATDGKRLLTGLALILDGGAGLADGADGVHHDGAEMRGRRNAVGVTKTGKGIAGNGKAEKEV
jgi:hypothetical protein